MANSTRIEEDMAGVARNFITRCKEEKLVVPRSVVDARTFLEQDNATVGGTGPETKELAAALTWARVYCQAPHDLALWEALDDESQKTLASLYPRAKRAPNVTLMCEVRRAVDFNKTPPASPVRLPLGEGGGEHAEEQGLDAGEDAVLGDGGGVAGGVGAGAAIPSLPRRRTFDLDRGDHGGAIGARRSLVPADAVVEAQPRLGAGAFRARVRAITADPATGGPDSTITSSLKLIDLKQVISSRAVALDLTMDCQTRAGQLTLRQWELIRRRSGARSPGQLLRAH